MDSDLAQKAISAALAGNWKEAVLLNKKLLKEMPGDCDTLNRLAKAYFELGEVKKAKTTCEKILKIDPFDTIANKNFNKWKTFKSYKKDWRNHSRAANFLEEPGKTKLVPLLHLGDNKVLAKLNTGDEVKLTPHSHRVSVVNLEGKYVGRLPDDLAARLRQLIKAGNCYQVLIKSLETQNVRVFIRELSRAKKMAKTPSFPAERINYFSEES